MKKAVLPILLLLTSGVAMACPGADKAMDAKATSSTTVAAAQPSVIQQIKAEAEKKETKVVEAKKSKS